jgi:thiamine biosynthesis lipoprotein ApbE
VSSDTTIERGGQAAMSWPALGTAVVLRVSDRSAAGTARAAIEHELDAIDRACSRFRPDSELMYLNARAGRPTRVGPVLFEALELALRAARLTDGDVDPTIGRALELIGYDRDWQDLAPAGPAAGRASGRPEPRIAARVQAGWRTVALDSDTSTVTVRRGIRLDLGATAKAWAADRAAAAAARAAGCGVLVAVGGDLATAGEAPRTGWTILVTDDHRGVSEDAPAQTIALFSGGVATSSTAVRRWRHVGREHHHIIDPRSGLSARAEWRTVSVAAGDCADANIASTAAIIRGRTAIEWLTGLGLPARLVAPDGSTREIAGWPSP